MDKQVTSTPPIPGNVGQSLHLNPYVLCVINMGYVDESMKFGNILVSNAHVMV